MITLGAAVSLLQGQSNDLREAARLDGLRQCEAAEKIYQRLLSTGPPSVALLNNAGNHYLTCDDSTKAEMLFRRVLDANVAHGNANLQIARLDLKAGRAAEALKHASHAQNEGPVARLVYAEALHLAGNRSAARDVLATAERTIEKDDTLLLALALTEERIEAFDRAESIYSRLLARRPDDASLLFRLGRSAARAEHWDRSIRALEAAARLSPKDVDVLLELGRSYAASGNAPRAVYVLAHARKLAPGRPEVLLTLARAAEHAGYYGDSALAYDEYIALKPSDETAKRDRALIYGLTQVKLPEALRELQAYVQKHPSDAVAWFSLARLTWATEPPRALEYLNQAVRADGRSLSIRFARAWLLYRSGRVADSVPDLDVALELAPKNVEVLAQLGLAYLSMDKPADAEQVLRRALAEAPEASEVLLHLGRALVALDRSEEAQPYLAKFQQLRPAMVHGPRTEPGIIDSATIPEAERTRRQIVRLRSDLEAHPGDTALQLHLAGLLLAGGHIDQASTEFQAALAKGVDARLAHQAGKILLDTQQYTLAKEFLRKAAFALPEAGLDLAIATWLSEGPQHGLEVLGQIPKAQQSSDYLLLKAKLLDATGDTAASAQVLAKGIAQSATNPRVVCEAASLLVKQARGEEALRLLKGMSQTHAEEDPRLLTLMAGVLALVDKGRDAQVSIRSVEERWPEFAPAYLMQGYILARAGRFGEAKKNAQLAVALGGDLDPARCLLHHTNTCNLGEFLAADACKSSR